MEKKDFRNLLNITPHKEEQRKNIIKVWMKWDSNDADYIERSVSISPEILFENKKLIYCLAYITTNYDFKVIYYDENGNAFDINFDTISESWKDMTYEEICDQINSIELK